MSWDAWNLSNRDISLRSLAPPTGHALATGMSLPDVARLVSGSHRRAYWLLLSENDNPLILSYSISKNSSLFFSMTVVPLIFRLTNRMFDKELS